MLICLAERLARDLALRARFHSILESLGQNGGRRSPGAFIIDHDGPGPSRQVSRAALQPGSRNEAWARSLIWTLGAGLLLLWVLLVGGAYGFWAMTGDWAIAQVASISRATGLSSELATSIGSTATVAGGLVEPVLAVIGVVGSAVILVVTAVAARLLGASTRG
jgi:hypothetical protein